MNLLRKLLINPKIKGHEIDESTSTCLHEKILASNIFLSKIYEEWYAELFNNIPDGVGRILEIGTGVGFRKSNFPMMIRSDIQPVKNINLVCDGQFLPFPHESLKSILMINVLHHIQSPVLFLKEAERCLRKKGIIAMIEPWKNHWAELIYKNLHHERFDTTTNKWTNIPGRSMKTANGAIPWIIFNRDQGVLKSEFPGLKIESIKPLMPITYLLSGGLSMKQMMPGFSYSFWRLLERNIQSSCGMFAFILVRKIHEIHPRAS